MKLRLLAPALVALLFASGSAPAAEPKSPGYRVVVEIQFDEKGEPEGGRVIQSDDPTGEQVLNQMAIAMAGKIKQDPHLKDGKPVRFKVNAPFDFPVEFDEGPAANTGPKPAIRRADQPVYPAGLAAQGVAGGAVIEVVIGTDGVVKRTTVLSSSHPEFAASAETALKTWVFVPAMRDGTPIETRWRIAIAFATDKQDAELKWRVAPRPTLGSYAVAHRTQPSPAPAPAPATPTPAK